MCDEAHKYFGASKSESGGGLAAAVVDAVRLMRHEGIRVVISTQSPLAMPSELLELVQTSSLSEHMLLLPHFLPFFSFWRRGILLAVFSYFGRNKLHATAI